MVKKKKEPNYLWFCTSMIRGLSRFILLLRTCSALLLNFSEDQRACITLLVPFRIQGLVKKKKEYERRTEPVLLFLTVHGSLPEKLVRNSASPPEYTRNQGQTEEEEYIQSQRSPLILLRSFIYTERRNKYVWTLKDFRVRFDILGIRVLAVDWPRQVWYPVLYHTNRSYVPT